MPLKVRRRPLALSDRLEIWLHIAADNISAADKLTDRLEDIVQHLADFPRAGRERSELARGLRSFPVDQYLIFYRVAPDTLEIVRIFNAARKITPDLFAE